MTLTPDDLPDPGEMSQVICGCTSEVFHFVISAGQVMAVCASPDHPAGLDRVNGVWAAAWPLREIPPPLPAQHTWTPGCDGVHPPGPCPALRRETLTTPRGPQVSAVWVDEPPKIPPLPAQAQASPEVANAVLSGGDYDGALIYAPGDVTEYMIAGYQGGKYVRSGRFDGHGRAVMVLAPYPGMIP